MPHKTTLPTKEFVRRLLVHETALGRRPHEKESATFRVCEKLRLPLAKLMGASGFRMLLARALALAAGKIPSLSALQVKENGSLESTGENLPVPGSPEAAEGEVVLVSELLGLLVTFVGPELTRRFLGDIWPGMRNPDFNEENHHEEK